MPGRAVGALETTNEQTDSRAFTWVLPSAVLGIEDRDHDPTEFGIGDEDGLNEQIGSYWLQDRGGTGQRDSGVQDTLTVRYTRRTGERMMKICKPGAVREFQDATHERNRTHGQVKRGSRQDTASARQ